MDKLIYISVYKLEDEAVKAIEKLHAQGFRPDQVSVLAYNTERFNILFKPQLEEAALPEHAQQKADNSDLPREVEKALEPDIPVPAFVPAPHPEQAINPLTGYVPLAGLASLNLEKDKLLAHERSLQEGDILVILQTDEGQEYRPDLPLIK